MSLLDSLLQPALIEDTQIEQRTHARAALRDSGLPSARDEGWRYTSLRGLATKSFALRDNDAARRLIPAAIDARLASAGLRVVFVNGELRDDLCALDRLPEGVSVSPGVPVTAVDQGVALPPFTAANLALAQAGVTVRIEHGVHCDLLLHVIYIVQPTPSPIAMHTRVRIELGDGASLTVVEEHQIDPTCAHLDNRLFDIDVGARSRLTHTRLRIDGAAMNSVHATQYRLREDAEVRTFEQCSGQSLSRHQVDVDLIGDRARFVSGGVQALGGRAHSDVQLSVQHIARDTACDLIWRGIADRRARIGFTGNLHVHVGADGSDAKLSSKNLLLSADAEINTRPVLVIDADEVKAAHGATVGQLDEQALFYLRSRGIDRDRARAMLTHAFAIESLQVLDEGTPRDAMQWALQQAMAGFVGIDGP